MYSADLMESALKFAKSQGYSIRYEWFGGNGGGSCEISGKKWMFIDLALNTVDQCDLVIQCLQADKAIQTSPIPAPLRKYLAQDKAA